MRENTSILTPEESVRSQQTECTQGRGKYATLSICPIYPPFRATLQKRFFRPSTCRRKLPWAGACRLVDAVPRYTPKGPVRMLAPMSLDPIQLEASESLLPPDWDGPRCEKCASPLPGAQLVCKACGYYASLGTFVEVDAQWEAFAAGTPSQDATTETPWETIQRTIPPWAWGLIATNLAIVVGAIIARFSLPADEVLRTYVSVTAFIAGLIVLVTCHATCFIMAAASDIDMGVVDMVVKPLKAWVRTCRNLPERLWLVMAGTNGATSALAAALILGGIPFHVLLDWNFKQPPKQNLMGAIMAQAQKAPEGEKKGLEDAVSDFAGTADGVVNAAGGQKPNTPPAKPRLKADCLIIGYNLNSQENISQLLLATDHNGKLVYAGYVRPVLEPRQEHALRVKLGRSAASRSFVPTENSAAWVQPRFTCRVTYDEMNHNGQLTNISWDSLLGELDLPW